MPTNIPQEILEIIIGYATSDGHYFSTCAASVISLTSHTFHQIVLPYKFKSLTFHRRKGYLGTKDPKFCEAIDAGDAHALSLGPLVRELNLLNFMRSGRDCLENYVLQIPVERILKSVTSFQNLTRLSMQKCVTSPAIIKQLGKLRQLQSLHTYRCGDAGYGYEASYGALSDLQSLHTLGCEGDSYSLERHLAYVSMKNLRVLMSSDMAVTQAFLTTEPPVQLKELYLLTHIYHVISFPFELLWNYLARVTSLTHLSLADLRPLAPDGIPSTIFHLPKLQYLHIHVAFAPRFADQPMKEMRIISKREPEAMVEVVRRHWQGIVFPHVEYLKTDRPDELDFIPIEFWREFLLNVKEVG